MTTDLDIYRTAKLLLDQYREYAAIHAAMRADEMLDRGDMEGRTAWMDVIKAIEVLSNSKRSGTTH